jgi:rhamnose utilization protein RhaD (predicted bifunctional aldolase and dehydrogenase)
VEGGGHVIAGGNDLERLVNRSRALGADPTLVVHGGGNTSSKIPEHDHLGRPREVLRIKGSGTDLATIAADGFPGLYLDELLPLRSHAAMSDDEMVAHLARCMTDPAARRPSIETLLHGFLPHRHVDHTHADAICILTNHPGSRAAVAAALGPDVAVVPYLRPGFELSKRTAEHADARAVVLDKHGLVTWGETHEQSSDATVDLVRRAAAYIDERRRPAPAASGEPLADAAAAALLRRLRERLCERGRRVLCVDRSQRGLADRADVERVATAARGTPDHVLRIGARSIVVRDAAEVDEAVDAFVAAYEAYYARHAGRVPAGLGMLSPLPRVALVPGLGCVGAGPDLRTAKTVTEIAYRSHTVTAAVLDTFGEVEWLTEEEIFDFDYWPMELYKLSTAPARPELHALTVDAAWAPPGLAELLAARGAIIADGAASAADLGGIDAVVAASDGRVVASATASGASVTIAGGSLAAVAETVAGVLSGRLPLAPGATVTLAPETPSTSEVP